MSKKFEKFLDSVINPSPHLQMAPLSATSIAPLPPPPLNLSQPNQKYGSQQKWDDPKCPPPTKCWQMGHEKNVCAQPGSGQWTTKLTPMGAKDLWEKWMLGEGKGEKSVVPKPGATLPAGWQEMRGIGKAPLCPRLTSIGKNWEFCWPPPQSSSSPVLFKTGLILRLVPHLFVLPPPWLTRLSTMAQIRGQSNRRQSTRGDTTQACSI